jgi:hypothetical protein
MMLLALGSLSRESTLAKVLGTAFLLSLLVPSALATPLYQIQIQVNTMSPVFAGQTETIAATVQLGNGTTIGTRVGFTAKLYYPNGTLVTLPAPTIVTSALVKWTYALPANAPDGLYSVTIYATVTGVNATTGLGSFTVNSQIASKSGFTSITTSLASISSQLGTVTSNLAALSAGMKGNFSSVVSTISTDYTALSGGVSAIRTGLSTLSLDMKANFTSAATTLSSDYGSLYNTMSSDFNGMKLSLGGLSTDIRGNFTEFSGTLQTITATLSNLATSTDISVLNGNISASFRSLGADLGQLASSSQASDLKSSLDSLTNQVTLGSNIQDFLILPVVLLLLIVLVFVLFRKPKS